MHMTSQPNQNMKLNFLNNVSTNQTPNIQTKKVQHGGHFDGFKGDVFDYHGSASQKARNHPIY
jgi:hypothetical protein